MWYFGLKLKLADTPMFLTKIDYVNCTRLTLLKKFPFLLHCPHHDEILSDLLQIIRQYFPTFDEQFDLSKGRRIDYGAVTGAVRPDGHLGRCPFTYHMCGTPLLVTVRGSGKQAARKWESRGPAILIRASGPGNRFSVRTMSCRYGRTHVEERTSYQPSIR